MKASGFVGRVAGGILGLTVLFGALNPNLAAAEENPKPAKKIVINSASRILSLYENGERKAIYPLGLGKTYTPTPSGYFKIQSKEVNPSWIDPSNPEYEVPSGPNNPLGYRWMRIKGNYGIHGTNKPASIGHYVSNGCVRMFEKDVEKLFDAVDIGTPVEITYQRVVIEKAPDENIVYYIYPDGYGWQKLNVATVRKWLEPYGIAAFESDADIAQKIKKSDGQPTYLGKPYNIEVDDVRVADTEQNGKKFLAKAVIHEGITYLPAVPIAIAVKTKLEWRASEATLKTAYGEVTGYEKGNQLYLNSDDAIVLFKIDGGLQNVGDKPADGKIIRLRTVPLIKEAIPENQPENNPIENPGEPPETQPTDNNMTQTLSPEDTTIPEGVPQSMETDVPVDSSPENI